MVLLSYLLITHESSQIVRFAQQQVHQTLSRVCKSST